jgi:putative transposase
VILNSTGKIVNKFWRDISKHYPNIELDYFAIMPNRLHGIIIFNDTLGNVIGSFKSAVSKWNHQNNNEYFQWQPRFYDHIIRNEKDLHRIRTYIQNNPLKWELDEYYNTEFAT